MEGKVVKLSRDIIDIGFTLATIGSFTLAAGVPAIIVGVGSAASVTDVGYGLSQHISKKKVNSEDKLNKLEPVKMVYPSHYL